jgi:hypothetical protein
METCIGKGWMGKLKAEGGRLKIERAKAEGGRLKAVEMQRPT